MFIFPAIIVLIQTSLILIFFNYETPYYLIFCKNNEPEAKKVLSRIYYEEDVDDVLNYIKETNLIAAAYHKKKEGFKAALFGSKYWRATLIGFML